ncbi:MAG: hypothetical protein A3E82_07950 [Gammaproteobacteria bacterium RIFCSPHIGHO2_12_FULL_38_11]|nr:MAG: hypothetical protein A3E82_07950 [Gammaproteobacteria bacterium RIFCSPHIGHO2_12_FULL_38_11]
MKRLIIYDLKKWTVSHSRKPLLMRGARQVGKTHAVRELGKNFTYFVEINFERSPEFITVFEKDLDPVRIVNTLFAMTNQIITSEKTLLFFDEIQFCPKAITALRYFYEEMPALHVIGAGSLLDFTIEEIGVPVGRIQYCYMYPLSFMEFLASLGNKSLFEMILSHSAEKPLDELFHHKLFELLGQYMLLGGMPGTIAGFLKENNMATAYRVQNAIINAYRDDFPKYAKKLQIKYVEALFNYIPHCIAESFKFSHIPGNYQKRELDPALNLLVKAGVVHKVYQSAGNGIPLGAEANLEKYKLLFLDIALSQAMLGSTLADWLLNPLQTFINKGSFTEAFVGQELLAYSSEYTKTDLYYWHREKQGSNAEVDYLIQLNENIIPVEVKSGAGSTLKSLHLFLESKPQSPFGIRFSTLPYSIEAKLHSYPLYAIAGCLTKYHPDLKERLYTLISA